MIELKNISFSIGNKLILDNVSLEIPENCIHVFLGPSGCGKTTLLRLISGLEKPTKGSLRKDNVDVTGKLGSKVGFVFQHLALWPHMNVENHLQFMLRGSIRQNRERIQSLLREVKLGDRGKAYPHQMSGGEKQRLAIARAVVGEPELLLMDEPFSNLDVLLRTELTQTLRELVKKDNMTILYVTHNIYEALELADSIILFNAHMKQRILTKEELSSMSQNEIVNLYKENQNA